MREPADFIARSRRARRRPSAPCGSTRRPRADALARIVTGAGGKVTRGADPIALMKAVKNPVEIEGAREAQRRDGAAMARFLAWFDREAPSGKLTEIDAVEALETLPPRDRRCSRTCRFRPSPAPDRTAPSCTTASPAQTNRTIAPGELFLIDSGGQYEDGTTDITRTVAVGEPTAEMRERFTLRAQGPHRDRARGVSRRHHRRAARPVRAARICGRPASTSITAPATASAAICRCTKGRRASPSSAPRALKRGMILSNEPGYYKTGAYGIRIENLVLVVEAPPVAGGEKPLNAFETLTLAPIDRRLIDAATADAPTRSPGSTIYHARVAEALVPLVDAETRPWLDAATRPLGQA